MLTAQLSDGSHIHVCAQHAPYRAVGLDNGALLIAEDARFDQVFLQQAVEQVPEQVRYVTQGRVVDEELRKTK